VFHRGQLVVDLTGGWRDNAGTIPYTPDTLQLVFSTTKGVVATAVAMCVERGLFDYDDLVSHIWPNFAQAGKGDVTVAQLLSHQAGLYTVDGPLEFDNVLDWNEMVTRLAATAPRFAPGSAHAYHALTFGWLAGELVRLTDGRNIGRFVREEIASPLGVEAYIGLPEHLETRVAPVNTGWAKPKDPSAAPAESKAGKFATPLVDDSPLTQALTLNGAMNVKGGFNRRDLHAAEVPGANCITNARSMATMYAATMGEVDVEGKSVRLVSQETIERARTPQVPSRRDGVLIVNTRFAMGYMLNTDANAFPGEGCYGHPGAGGSVSFADPSRELAFSYVMNRMTDALLGDPRATRLVAAATRCADAL
jgi:CubicO group peptidase (beta-lactamase class C family)